VLMIRSIARYRNKVHTFEIIFQFFKTPMLTAKTMIVERSMVS
jgi:hypothetical protein